MPSVGCDGSDEADAAARRLAHEHDAADAGLLPNGDGQVAQVAGIDTVETFDDDTVDGRTGELAGPAGRQLRPHLLEFGLERLHLVELALHAVDDIAGRSDQTADLGELSFVALQERDRRRRR